MNKDQLEIAFNTNEITDEQRVSIGKIYSFAYELGECILLECPASADRTAAFRKLREAVMVAEMSIVLKGSI